MQRRRDGDRDPILRKHYEIEMYKMNKNDESGSPVLTEKTVSTQNTKGTIINSIHNRAVEPSSGSLNVSGKS